MMDHDAAASQGILAAQAMLARAPIVRRATWSVRDTVLYNLGIGIGQQAMQAADMLPFVMEERARLFPAMVSTIGGTPTHELFQSGDNVDLARIVHGEEEIRLHCELLPEGDLTASFRIGNIWDKGVGKGAILTIRRQLHDQRQRCVADVTSTLVLRGNGGFGGSGEGSPRPLGVPDRPADACMTIETRAEQALLYRLSGDRNLLHVDPQAARAAGFDRPILMGLCSFGIAATALVRFGGYRPESLNHCHARFVGVVHAGDAIAVSGWRQDARHWHWQASVGDRLVMDGGRAGFATP